MPLCEDFKEARKSLDVNTRCASFEMTKQGLLILKVNLRGAISVRGMVLVDESFHFFPVP